MPQACAAQTTPSRTATRRASATALALLALAGCASPAGDSRAGPSGGSPSASAPSASAPSSSTPRKGPPPSIPQPGISAAALVGFWRVQAAGEADGTLLRLGETMALTRACGLLIGSWRVGGQDLFLGYAEGSTGRCAGPTARAGATPRWLRQAERARRDGDGWQLRTAGGLVVAKLTRAARPTQRRTSGLPADFLTAPTAPPPSGMTPPATTLPKGPPGPAAAPTPATAAELAGRWVPLRPDGRRSTGRAYLALEAGGEWSGSDGCNASAGRWTAGEGGQLIAVAGPQTLMACLPDQVPTSLWLVSAAKAVLLGPELILIGAGGRPIGRLSRA